MAIEESPIYELLIRDMGSPILSPAMDCSYAAVIEMAGYASARSAEPAAASVPAPSKLTPRAAQKPLASVARKNAS
ncbi:MAG: hypothetical protein ACT4QF_19115 [Sporichthyaceae bacterium]